MKKIALALFLALICWSASAQKKNLTLEQIANDRFPAIQDYIMPPKWISAEEVQVTKMDLSNGKREHLLYNVKTGKFADYTPQTSQIAATSDIREDAKKANGLIKGDGMIANPTYSPDGKLMAFTNNGDLYVYDKEGNSVKRITTDGSNVILNGRASWVYYEEILGRSSQYKAYWWSPDSKTIAFYRFDDSEVPMFPIYDPSKAKDQILESHYPMSGEKNPEVRIGFADVQTGNIVWADFDEKEDQYFGIPFWNSESSRFIVPWMPRVQQDLLFYSVNPENGSKEPIYKEHQDTWIDWPEQMLFDEQGLYMVRDFTMWEQIYYLSFDGKTQKCLTDGRNWDIKLLKIDKKKGELYFTSKKEKSTRVDIYKVSLKKPKTTRISTGDFSYKSLQLSDDFKYMAAICSNAQTPDRAVLLPTDGSGKMTVLADGKGKDFDSYDIALPKMVEITTPDGYTIPAKITLPLNFDPQKKYPVIIYMYGGPNTPVVSDSWSMISSSNQWWANQDVIQFTMDHRGSGHCGKEGCNFMYRNFFSIELKDFIEWAKYLRSLPYVDADKIGIYGFSYGGSMATLCVTEGCEYFKYGIAGGGVYDYMLYDTHYTERFMDTPQRNPEGYKRTIMAERVRKSGYKGDATNYLMLTHGAADDNVHIQNTMALVLELQKMGRQFDLMIYPRQLHGYRGAQGQFSNFNDYRFWYRHLLGKEVPEELSDAFSK
ncbi:MAG: DPP IV N-terminal domain-containing protein [Bacteroidales bacterium]|nr:DPP IV N-terminal domain-containing protein [Bacteroidales bacterium]